MQRRKVQAFLFDLDGVLVDTGRIIHHGWEIFASTRGLTVPEADYPRFIYGRRTREILVDYFQLSEKDADHLLAEGFDDKTALVAGAGGLVEIAGSVEFVRASRSAGLRLAVASSASWPNVAFALESLGLSELMDAIITSADVSVGKPAPDPYLAAARALGVEPARAIVFEDTTFGIQSAQNAGAMCVALATTFARDQLSGADLIIDDFVGWQPGRVLEALGA
jgi:beta-phosphoglucomutase-like phosphatase (HAD superfamily)